MATKEEQAAIAAFIAANGGIEAIQARLAMQSKQPVTMKISQRGAVSVYGLGRNPVTLYGSQIDGGVAAGIFSPDCGLVKFRREWADHLSGGKGIAPKKPLAAKCDIGEKYDPAEADRKAEARKARS